MKRKINIVTLLITLSLLFLSSCDRMLDKDPLNYVPADVALRTEDGVEALLNGAYRGVMARYYHGFFMIAYDAVKGPDFFQRQAGGGSNFQYDIQYNTASTNTGNSRYAWRDIYRVIRDLTVLLENIDKVPGDMNNLRRIKGEAYALRGMAYFDLMRIFAFPPRYSCTWGSAFNSTFELGVPIPTDPGQGTTHEDYYIRRKTADETYEYIEEQFDKAIPLIKGNMSQQGYIDEPTVLALYMRIKLYQEKWDDVIEIGEYWMDNFDTDYSLLAYNSYKTNYHRPFNSESIWELPFSNTENLGSNSINYWARRPTVENPEHEDDGKVTWNTGYSKLAWQWGHPNRGKDFLEYYEKDVRQHLICELGINENPDFYGCRRYVGNPYHYIHNVPMVRLPEIYFTLAEAYLNRDRLVEASELVSRVSVARRLEPIDVLRLTDILDERRREFMLEGHTFWDMFRTGTNMTDRQIIEYNDDVAINFGSTSSPHVKAVPPIPLQEMNYNEAIRDQQNPGYADWVLAIEEEE